MNGWIGVDLDGTLAHYDGWKGAAVIGEPIPAMVDRVKAWRAAGQDVRIFTARVAGLVEHLHPTREEVMESVAALTAIKDWCRQHIGADLKVTCVKDTKMVFLWDDRCVQVVTNTGQRADGVA